jgi:PKD repeat protein
MLGKRIAILLLIAASIIAVTVPSAMSSVVSQALPLVSVNPSIGGAGVGQSYFVNITVSNVLRLYSWQINITFNPAVLQFVNDTEGDFLKGMPEGSWTVTPDVDNTVGFALFGWSTQGDYIGPSGSGWLGTAEFSVIAKGESVLNITNSMTKLIEYRRPPPPPGENIMKLIPHARQNGFFTNVAVPPHAEFSYSPIIPVLGAPVTFNASASYAVPPSNITRFEWDFGDNTTVNYVRGINLTYTANHTYTNSGVYTVSLVVVDDTPASDLVKSVFGTTGMPHIWYEIGSKFETNLAVGAGHDIAVTDVTVSKVKATVGEIVYINVTVLNKGASVENFSVAAYYGANMIDKKPVKNLNPGAYTSVMFNWDTSNVAAGIYSIKAVATDVVGEVNPADNTKIDGTVEVLASSNSTFPLMLVGAAIVIIIVVALLAAFFLLRRRKGAQPAQPAQPA